MNLTIIKKIKKAPKKPGVYLFLKGKNILYIGKAANLKSRLTSYLKLSDLKTKTLWREATDLHYLPCQSAVEALIKESQLIKTLKPTLNVYWQDDKNYFYVAFTGDQFPKIFITHQPKGECLGPFTDGSALRLILRALRRQYLYCTCFQPHRRYCLNAQINNCFGYCCALQIPNEEKLPSKTIADQHRQYQKNIKTISALLLGKQSIKLSKLVNSADQWALENILDHQPIFAAQANWQRLECYDISHLAGKEAIGVMTVLVNHAGQWQPSSVDFRKFKIKTANTQDDPRMIAEVLSRRLRHPEWPYPNLIIIDGGITQYNAAKKVLDDFFSHLEPKTFKLKPRLISFAKPHRQIIGDQSLPINKLIVEKAIAQTHRYAIASHRRFRRQMLGI